MTRTQAPAPCQLVGEGVSLELVSDVLLGSGEGVDVHVRGFFVSPVHARITRDPEGKLELSCFGSAKVRLNGQKVSAARLEIGDEIAVGRSRLSLLPSPDAPV